MAIKLDGYADKAYPQIARGTSLRIPIFYKREDGSPFDVADYTLYFTMKPSRGDYNYHDDRAIIHKEFEQDTTHVEIINRYFLDLTSKDTYIPWGKYFFDIELKHHDDGAVVRLATFLTEIVEGPTNRTINPDNGQRLFGSAITAQLATSAPIVIVAPLIADPPPHNVEQVLAKPSYYVTDGDTKFPTIHQWGPKISREIHGSYIIGDPTITTGPLINSYDEKALEIINEIPILQVKFGLENLILSVNTS